VEKTDCTDLSRMLLLSSPSTDAYIRRRDHFVSSVASMSATGYILGLGDRHPSNVMIARDTHRVVHIDFGDCFETAQMRARVPETVHFRVTRMMIAAMDVSGIYGAFTERCVRVMESLRSHRRSLLALLDTFVHDPLLHWRVIDVARPSDPEIIVNGRAGGATKNQAVAATHQQTDPKGRHDQRDAAAHTSSNEPDDLSASFPSAHSNQGDDAHRDAEDGDGARGVGAAASVVAYRKGYKMAKEQAIAVMTRIEQKLTGNDAVLVDRSHSAAKEFETARCANRRQLLHAASSELGGSSWSGVGHAGPHHFGDDISQKATVSPNDTHHLRKRLPTVVARGGKRGDSSDSTSTSSVDEAVANQAARWIQRWWRRLKERAPAAASVGLRSFLAEALRVVSDATEGPLKEEGRGSRVSHGTMRAVSVAPFSDASSPNASMAGARPPTSTHHETHDANEAASHPTTNQERGGKTAITLPMTTREQIRRVIDASVSDENLSQMFSGWMAIW
jgi:hypothetical protein